ncbi:hypothetical protein N9I01_00505 [bacterium]|nr:hypothetical protein [bacterium]
MALETAEQYDPFLKKNVYGNILDQVDNYQYNLKLYMIPPVGKPVGTQPAADQQSGSVDARLDKPTNAKNASGQGGYLQNSLVASPAETVILAQTGVTGTQIDNLEIVSAVNASMGVEIAQVNFDIIQPGAADFLDQIVSAKAFLGDQITAQDVPIFLEINFKGYDTDIDDEDGGGVPILAAGPYRYMLKIANVTLEIDDTGSTYQFSTVPVQQLAYIDTNYRMPKKIESIGTTIEEHVKDLVAKITEHTASKYPADEFLSLLIAGINTRTLPVLLISLVETISARYIPNTASLLRFFLITGFFLLEVSILELIAIKNHLLVSFLFSLSLLLFVSLS